MTALVSCNKIAFDDDGAFEFYPTEGGYVVAVRDPEYIKHMEEIEIPYLYKFKPVVGIANNGFAYCSNLKQITIPSGVETIGDYAFSGCESLWSLDIPSSVVGIGEGAFEDCTSLTSITVANDNQNYTSIDGNLYNKNGSTLIRYAIGKADSTFTMPNSVTSIASDAFRGCTSLTSVTIGNGVTSIGSAFSDCRNLTSVTIGSGVTSIDYSAFRGCTGLTSVKLPDSVTSIGDSAFYGCTGLTSVKLPESVTSIGLYAFYGCTGLTSVKLPDSVTSIGSSAFCNTAYYKKSSNWENDVLYIGKHLIEAKERLSGTYKIKEGTLCIGDWAFSDCDGLTSVTIPDGVRSIGCGAFYNCESLTSVTIGNSVTNIGDLTFYKCENLTSVTIGNSVTSIGNSAFRYCYSLTSVRLPDSVTSIGDYAFSNCDSLTSIKYRGTEAEWVAISKGYRWDGDSGASTITYNYDGE